MVGVEEIAELFRTEWPLFPARLMRDEARDEPAERSLVEEMLHRQHRFDIGIDHVLQEVDPLCLDDIPAPDNLGVRHHECPETCRHKEVFPLCSVVFHRVDAVVELTANRASQCET